MDERTNVGAELLSEVVKAMIDKHGQVDIRVDGLALQWKGTPIGVELNGTVTLSVHMRDLSPAEKKAHEAATVARIAPRGARSR